MLKTHPARVSSVYSVTHSIYIKLQYTLTFWEWPITTHSLFSLLDHLGLSLKHGWNDTTSETCNITSRTIWIYLMEIDGVPYYFVSSLFGNQNVLKFPADAGIVGYPVICRLLIVKIMAESSLGLFRFLWALTCQQSLEELLRQSRDLQATGI